MRALEFCRSKPIFFKFMSDFSLLPFFLKFSVVKPTLLISEYDMLSSAAPKPTIGSKPNFIDVLIIGGGLSGLMVAHEIQHSLASSPPLSWKLLEAREVLGGRLTNDSDGQDIDLGGAWIWPTQQPFLKKLTKTLGVKTFVQPDDPASTRIEGGAVQFIHKISEKLPKGNIVLNSPVVSCSLIDGGSSGDDHDAKQCDVSGGPLIKVKTATESLLARRVVLATPPKLASKYIEFSPPLSEEKKRAMSESQTWMAGVTKVALVYPKKFWTAEVSNMGLPAGIGPAFQVYDASTSSISALTFFTLVPSESEASDSDPVLAKECATQIQQVWNYFGEKEMSKKAKNYTGYHIQRWPIEKYISEDSKPRRINPHPQPVRALSTTEWNGALLFAGSETDRMSPGVMEGAVSAAIRVVQYLKEYFASKK